MPLSGTKFLRAIIPSGDKAVRNFWALRTLKLAHRAEHLGHQSLPSAHLNPIEDQGPQETSPKLAAFFLNILLTYLLTFPAPVNHDCPCIWSRSTSVQPLPAATLGRLGPTCSSQVLRSAGCWSDLLPSRRPLFAKLQKMHLNETDHSVLTQLHRRLRRGPESFNTFYWNQLGAVWFEKASHTANIKLRRQRWANILNEIN